MPQVPSDDGLIDAITTLALEIAQTSPEVSAKALRIAELACELRKRRSRPDRSVVHDVLEEEAVDSDWSDSEIERATDAIVKGFHDKE